MPNDPPSRTGLASLFDQRAKLAFIVAAATLTICGLGFRTAVGYLDVYLRKEPVPLRHHLGTIPRIAGRWEAIGDDQVLDEAAIEALGTDKYLSRLYALDGEVKSGLITLHIAYYTGLIDAVPHIPDRCFVAAGWTTDTFPSNYKLTLELPGVEPEPTLRNRAGEPYMVMQVAHPVTGTPESIHLPFGEARMRATGFVRQDERDARLWGGYFFIANHRTTSVPGEIRLLAFNPSERFAYYAKVQLTMITPAGEGPQRFLDLSSDFLSATLPHLMRCLPDWSEVEAGQMVVAN